MNPLILNYITIAKMADLDPDLIAFEREAIGDFTDHDTPETRWAGGHAALVELFVHAEMLISHCMAMNSYYFYDLVQPLWAAMVAEQPSLETNWQVAL